MPSYQCCDCGEIKATKSDLEAHLNVDHIGWTPYQCFHCSQQDVSTRKPNKELLRKHVTERHPGQEFTYLCTDDKNNNEQLKDMLRRSTIHDQSLNVVCGTPVSLSASSSTANPSPSIISLSESPHIPKQEVLDIEELQGHLSGANKDDIEPSAQMTDRNADDIKPNANILGNCRCATCEESVPRNLMLIRDHVKVHFKEKTGCLPVDLMTLLPSLQQVYCRLLITSFPAVGASILEDDIPNCNRKEVPQQINNDDNDDKDDDGDDDDKDYDGNDYGDDDDNDDNDDEDECDDRNSRENEALDSTGFYNSKTNKYECQECRRKFGRFASLRTHLRKCKSKNYMFSDNSTSGGYECNDCGRKFGRLASLKSHLRLCNLENVQDEDDLSIATIDSDESFNKDDLVSCDVCNETFSSKRGMHTHRHHKHGIMVRWYCKGCKIDLRNNELGFRLHLLRVHLRKQLYKCSLCEAFVLPRSIDTHDEQFHDGHGKAEIVNNLHRFESQVELLRKSLIIDLNSSLNSVKRIIVDSRPQTSSHTQQIKLQTKQPTASCDICSKTFPSRRSFNIHRVLRHGVQVQLSCKQCKVNLMSNHVVRHLLHVHMRKKEYVCSLCNIYLAPHAIERHDVTYHGGFGKTSVICNSWLYQKEIEELLDSLIIDTASSIVTDGKLTERKLKLRNHIPSDNLIWFRRFKRSQNAKLERSKLLAFKRRS